MTVKSSISLTDEQHAFAKALVDAGKATSLSGVLQQGVEMLRRQEEDRTLERAALRDILAKRQDAAGETARQFDLRLEDMIAHKRKAMLS